MEQMYESVPAALNVRENVSPRPRTGELATSVKVTVWATTSLFVHTTVVPALTVSTAGSNLKLVMLTFAPAGAGVVAEGAAGEGAGVAAGAWAMFIGSAAMFVDGGAAEFRVEAPLGEQAAIPMLAAIASAPRRGPVMCDFHGCTPSRAGFPIMVSPVGSARTVTTRDRGASYSLGDVTRRAMRSAAAV